jgi:hypothetical protein
MFWLRDASAFGVSSSAVFGALVRGDRARLMRGCILPQEWTEDPQRCDADIPKAKAEQVHRTKLELAEVPSDAGGPRER